MTNDIHMHDLVALTEDVAATHFITHQPLQLRRGQVGTVVMPLNENDFQRAFRRFKDLADKKKYVFDEDIEALISEEFVRSSDFYKIVSANFSSGTDMRPVATIKLLIDGEEVTVSEYGDGPVDAAYKAISKATGVTPNLERYVVAAITGGTDAQGEVTVRIEEDGIVSQGQGASTDIIVASAKAFVNTNPLPGEKDRYEGLRWTGAMGEDYATIALLPNVTHDGSVLIMQGLQQEGTEAAGRFLADPENRRQLLVTLGITGSRGNSFENIWFEALIRSRTVAGAPNSTTLVAVRRID